MKKSLFIALFVAIIAIFAACNGKADGYQIKGNMVKYTTDYYTLYPCAEDNNSLLLVTWYQGQEYAALVSCDTPRNAQLTVVFDDCGCPADLQGYCIVDCIFTD